VAAAKGVAAPAGTEGDGGDAAKAGRMLLSGERRAVFLGNAAVRTRILALHALAQWIAQKRAPRWAT
jgi:NADH-quinone oxidoreductase subunit G